MKRQILWFFIASILLFQVEAHAQIDSTRQRKWIHDKISFGRSQHIQYLGLKKPNKTNTLFNKSYYASLYPFNYKGLKPFISLNYEYFITRAKCYTCMANNAIANTEEQFHFINFASIGSGFIKEITFRNKKGKQFEIVVGASIERYLFKRAFIIDQGTDLSKVLPFEGSSRFFNHFFFKDLYGVRVYNSKSYKVIMQLSGVLLRNERLNYLPSRHTFHNFMLGFNVFLK